jgi:hypothetical protein
VESAKEKKYLRTKIPALQVCTNLIEMDRFDLPQLQGTK